MKDASKILDKKQLQQKVNRLAWQVYERNYTQKEIVIVGIEKRGVVLSKRLANVISDISDLKVSSATISLDKDNPYSSEIIFSLDSKKIENKVVILVDDVLNSGKTLMYATKEFLSVPIQKLSTLVLVNRNHNRFPIKADYEGMSLSTTLQEHINVVFGKEEGVYLS
ncbi:MAG: phosphoribosyltransferase [Flavobacteriales bacterium]|jgi:pyrimidine operon attenuation protein / uracil phosphoribosyltransferase|nr:phosphoribosyltransferase [Flavobacteriales bacterium]